MTIQYSFNPFTGNFDQIDKLTNPLVFKGSIAVNTDFPLAADVQNGWMYAVTANVTDDAGSTYTNTGLSFLVGDEIVWTGVTWDTLGSLDTNKVKYNAGDASPDYLCSKTVAGVGIGLAEGAGGDAGKLKITNSCPDQTVSLTGCTGITTAGTYPTFCITNSLPDQTVSFTGGTNVTVGGTYPAFTISDASASTTALGNHASCQSGIHGIGVTAGKCFCASATLTLAGTDAGCLNIGAGGTLGTAAYTAATAYDASGLAASCSAAAVSAHASLQTGVHGISITALKTLTATNSMTLSATDGGTLCIGAGGTLGSAAYTASTNYQAACASLTSLAGLTYASNSIVRMCAACAFCLDTGTYLTDAPSDGSTYGRCNGAWAVPPSADDSRCLTADRSMAGNYSNQVQADYEIGSGIVFELAVNSIFAVE